MALDKSVDPKRVSTRPLAQAGLQSERLLWPTKGKGVFEEEVENLEDALGLTTLEKAVAWAQTKSMWPATFGLACCAIEMMSIVSSRYDIARFGMEKFSSSPRQADLLIVSGRVAHKMAAPLRQVYDQMLEPKWVIAMGACASSGGMFNNYTILQGVDKIVAGRHPRARLPTAAGGADGGDHAPAREGAGRGAARLPDSRSGLLVSYEGVPGLVETKEAFGETTLVVDPTRLVEACSHLRDELGFDLLVDITATDYLGWGETPVAGYYRHGRRSQPQRARRAGVRAHAGAEADALHAQLSPRSRRRRLGARARPGPARRRRPGRDGRSGLAHCGLARARGLRHVRASSSTATRT